VKNEYLYHKVCLCPHVTARLLLIEFPCTFISDDFTKVYVERIQD
jgi:hypothetical protein